MIYLLVFIYAWSLIQFSVTERVKVYVRILAFQGLLLTPIAWMQLRDINAANLVLIIAETLIAKAIVIPLFLERTRKRNKLKKLSESNFPAFVSVIVVAGIVVLGFTASYFLETTHLQTKFFAIAISSVGTGLFFIITHRNVFTHLIGYMIMENGIFLLSLALGAELPMMVNSAVLLDLFAGILMLGMFLNRVGDTFESIHAEHLTDLKD